MSELNEFEAIGEKLWTNYVETAKLSGVRNVGSLNIKQDNYNIIQLKTKLYNILTKISLATYRDEWKTSTDFNGKESYMLRLDQMDIEIYQNVNVYVVTLYSKDLIAYEGLEHKYLQGVLEYIKKSF
jgi:hypothetical protein